MDAAPTNAAAPSAAAAQPASPAAVTTLPPAEALPAVAPAAPQLTDEQKKFMQDLAKAAAASDNMKLEELFKRVPQVGVPESDIEFARVVHRRLASQSVQSKTQERKKAKARLRTMRKNARTKLTEAVVSRSKTQLKAVRTGTARIHSVYALVVALIDRQCCRETVCLFFGQAIAEGERVGLHEQNMDEARQMLKVSGTRML